METISIGQVKMGSGRKLNQDLYQNSKSRMGEHPGKSRAFKGKSRTSVIHAGEKEVCHNIQSILSSISSQFVLAKDLVTWNSTGLIYFILVSSSIDLSTIHVYLWEHK